MPTVLNVNGFRFYFYSNENNEPVHLHGVKGNAEGKVWLEPEISIAYMHGFSNAAIKEIEKIIEINYITLKIKWYGYFSK